MKVDLPQPESAARPVCKNPYIAHIKKIIRCARISGYSDAWLCVVVLNEKKSCIISAVNATPHEELTKDAPITIGICPSLRAIMMVLAAAAISVSDLTRNEVGAKAEVRRAPIGAITDAEEIGARSGTRPLADTAPW